MTDAPKDYAEALAAVQAAARARDDAGLEVERAASRLAAASAEVDRLGRDRKVATAGAVAREREALAAHDDAVKVLATAETLLAAARDVLDGFEGGPA